MKLRQILIFLNLSLFMAIFLASGIPQQAAARFFPHLGAQVSSGQAGELVPHENSPTLNQPAQTFEPGSQPSEETSAAAFQHPLSAQPGEAFPALEPTPLPPPPPTFEAPTSPPIDYVDLTAGVNPLTGLPVGDPTRLERRPLGIKITHFPREVRPFQWGLNTADLVYEYYLEFGMTRFFRDLLRPGCRQGRAGAVGPLFRRAPGPHV